MELQASCVPHVAVRGKHGQVLVSLIMNAFGLCWHCRKESCVLMTLKTRAVYSAGGQNYNNELFTLLLSARIQWTLAVEIGCVKKEMFNFECPNGVLHALHKEGLILVPVAVSQPERTEPGCEKWRMTGHLIIFPQIIEALCQKGCFLLDFGHRVMLPSALSHLFSLPRSLSFSLSLSVCESQSERFGFVKFCQGYPPE